MKKYGLVLMICLLALGLSGCQSPDDKRVVIYSSSEEYRRADLQAELEKKFPDYDIVLEYYSTG